MNGREEPASHSVATQARLVPALSVTIMNMKSSRVLLVVGWLFALSPAAFAQSPPLPPEQLTATIDGATVTLTWWIPFGGGPRYRLEAGSAPNTSNVVNTMLAFRPDEPIGVRFERVPAGTYYVRVYARNDFGESRPSNEVTVTISPRAACFAAPPSPFLSVAISGPTATLTWIALAGCPATTYSLYAGSSPGGTNLGTIRVFGEHYTSVTVQPPVNELLYVHVRAENAYGISAPSNSVAVFTTPAPPAPPPPPPPPPAPLWTVSGESDDVVAVPAGVTLVRIQGELIGSTTSNFIVSNATDNLVNVVLNSEQRDYAGTHPVTAGTRLVIRQSPWIRWTFTEVRQTTAEGSR
jgi:hypothetical protein